MENELIFSQDRNISSAFIDSSLKIGIAQAVLMVQDNLTECFNMLGCDGVIYREKYNAFWVFTKSKLNFKKRPEWRQVISASTFPIDNAGFKTHINTILRDKNGTTLITANQEACVLDMEKHRPVKLSTLNYPKENFPISVFDEPFDKFDSDFFKSGYKTEDNFKYEQIIRSQHIDMSHHMNNIEYIKLALNIFSDDFLLSNEVKNLEVHYMGESKEGQVLKIYEKTQEKISQIIIRENERTVFEMQIEFY